MNKFKERLRDLRLEKKISRKQLASDLYVSERLISYWENGERECDFNRLIMIAKYFKVSADYLLGISEF